VTPILDDNARAIVWCVTWMVGMLALCLTIKGEDT
jgi:hypothetical protein